MSELLSIRDNKVIYNGVKMECFIPNYFFKNKYAEEIGTSYYIFGSFETFHYGNENDPRSKAKRASFQYPLKFYTNPDEVSEEKIDIGHGEQKYIILTYYKNAVLFESSDIIQDSTNVETFMTLLMNGKLDIMEYSQINEMLQLCKYYNNADLDVPGMYEEVLISEFYRNPKNPSEPARFTATSQGYRARGLNEREKVSVTSTFSALTFEDKKTMMTSAINNKIEGKEEVISDTEKITLSLI